MYLQKKLKKIASTLESNTDKASFLSFIESLNEIPRTLIKNNEKDIASIMKELSFAHEKDENFAFGVSTKFGIGDMIKEGVIEPFQSKISQISMGTQSAIQILKIDRNIHLE